MRTLLRMVRSLLPTICTLLRSISQLTPNPYYMYQLCYIARKNDAGADLQSVSNKQSGLQPESNDYGFKKPSKTTAARTRQTTLL